MFLCVFWGILDSWVTVLFTDMTLVPRAMSRTEWELGKGFFSTGNGPVYGGCLQLIP